MSKVDLVLLGLLMEKPRHGYDIKQQIEKRHMAAWVGITMPSIYKGLARLEKKKSLRARRESGEAHPDRTVYSITRQGRLSFQDLLHESLRELEYPFFRLLMGYGFAHLTDKNSLLESLRLRLERIGTMRRQVEEVKAKVACAESHYVGAEDIVQYYIDLIDMEKKWLKRVLARIESADPWPEGEIPR